MRRFKHTYAVGLAVLLLLSVMLGGAVLAAGCGSSSGGDSGGGGAVTIGIDASIERSARRFRRLREVGHREGRR